jgi:hypothetical protein
MMVVINNERRLATCLLEYRTMMEYKHERKDSSRNHRDHQKLHRHLRIQRPLATVRIVVANPYNLSTKYLVIATDAEILSKKCMQHDALSDCNRS